MRKLTSLTRLMMVVVALTIVLSACAGRVISPIRESNKDTSGAYDGRWIGNFVSTQSPQRIGDWLMNCGKPDVEFSILVKNGQVSTRINQDTNVAYIDGEGRFRIAIPSTSRATSSIASDLQLNSEITYFLEGTLGKEQPAGTFVVGVAEFGNNGCLSKIAYRKI